MRGRRRSVLTVLLIQKSKDEEEKKGGVSDGVEADFQTHPPTLTTYPRFDFLCHFIYLLLLFLFLYS